MSAQELKFAVTQLPKEELKLFSLWLEEYRADEWDRQIEADALAGRLDHLIARANADFGAGRCTPL